MWIGIGDFYGLLSIESLWSSCPLGRVWPENHPLASLCWRGEGLDFNLLPPLPLLGMGSRKRLSALTLQVNILSCPAPSLFLQLPSA